MLFLAISVSLCVWSCRSCFFSIFRHRFGLRIDSWTSHIFWTGKMLKTFVVPIAPLVAGWLFLSSSLVDQNFSFTFSRYTCRAIWYRI